MKKVNLLNRNELIFILILIILNTWITFFSSFNFLSFLPFPDTLFYINGVQSLLQGNFLTLPFPYSAVPIPFIYPVYLAPFMALTSNLYILHLSNLLLSAVSFFIFIKISKILIRSQKYLIVCWFLYSTNFVLIWYPALVMAENLLMLLFLSSVLLLLNKLTAKNILFISVLIVLFFYTKYIAITLSLALLINLIIKIFTEDKLLNIKIRLFAIMLLTLVLTAFVCFILEAVLKQTNPADIVIYHLRSLAAAFNSAGMSASNLAVDAPDTHFWSVLNAPNILRSYILGLFGVEIPVAGIYLHLVPPLIIIFLPLCFLTFYLSGRNFQFITYELSAIIFTLGLISLFYKTDGRYILVFIPLLILNFGLFFEALERTFQTYKLKNYPVIFFIFFSLFYLITTLYNLNAGYIEMNNFRDSFSNFTALNTVHQVLGIPHPKEKIYLITTIPPLYFEIFPDQNNLNFLPLSNTQIEAPDNLRKLGISEKDYIAIYKDLLTAQKKIYLLSYATTGNFIYSYDFDRIKAAFKLVPVYSSNSCVDQCKIYELNIK